MPDPQVVTTPAPPAASPAPVVPPAPPAAPAEPPKPSLSRSLFPDFYDKDGKLMNKPDPNYGQPSPAPAPAPTPAPAAPAAPAPAPASPAPTPPTPPATPPADYLDLAQASNKRVKVKVNGVEVETTVDELVKNHQLNAHLTQKAQKLADDERNVKKLLDELVSKPVLPTGDDPPAPPAKPAKKPGESDAQFEQRLQRIEAGLAQVSEVTRGQRVDAALKSLGSQIAAETGHTDFAEFVPEIQQWVLAHVADPRNPTPQEQYYDTPEFYRSKFLELKLKKVSGAPPAPPPPPPPAPEPGKPVVTGIEPGGPGASGAGSVDDWQTRYDAAFEKAVKSGDMRDWAEVNRLKGEPQRS